MSILKSILKWQQIAKPAPTTEDACVAIGCHYEEVGEMVYVLCGNPLLTEVDRVAVRYKEKAAHYIDVIKELKDGEKIELLDSLCDQIVTAIGVAHMLDFDIEGALDEVNKSNYSKFEDGNAVLDGNGKIRKGRDYFKPDLTKFI
ncbi:nucleoside triphosphate pyrophosphohydrolase family protein [Candidatus Enterovibrio escicola]|uniref:nucleoside triphosphate pyrophosphohydrolase family protein n=1 Tax=Candidatus Enterovibrio escicola TaxID=1927127 RepID=UPI0012383491|nr:nucleoside triphosphate pyrophosphohydrolase family protein [Candidatus Enterovibrio escacola]